MNQITLSDLENLSVAFVDFADSLGRPLLASERRNHRWILLSWESSKIKYALTHMEKAKLPYYTDLIQKVREHIAPDPVKQVRLKRDKPEMVAERHEGNFSVKSPTGQGVAVRRITAKECQERIELLARLGEGIATLTRELALVRNRDRPEAARIGKLAKRMSKLAADFAKSAAKDPKPTETRSLDEIMEEMRTLNELMK